jgi:hypothetical protein
MIFSDDNSKWFVALDDCKIEGYTPIKVDNLLQFFTLEGRKTTLAKANLIPIPNLQYLLFSPQETRYYIKTYRGWSVDVLFFYRKTMDFSGQDEAVDNLRRYVIDGNIWLLYDKQSITDMSAFLKRLWKANFNDEGQVPYKLYIQLLQESINYEDYKSYASHLTGYKTVCNQFEIRIKELLDKIHKTKK